MAKINKPERKPKTTAHSDTEMRQLRTKAYQSTAWQKMRKAYITAHPICEDCLKEGVVYAGGDEKKGTLSVHHLRSPFKDGKINWEMLLDDNNLATLCTYHHGLRHAEEKGATPEKMIEILDALLPDDDFEDEDTGCNQ